MPEQLITCPNCGNEFEVGGVLTESIREQLRRELETELVKKQEEVKKRLDEARERERLLTEREESIDDIVSERVATAREKIAATERKRVEQEMKLEVADLQAQIEEGSQKLGAAMNRELELAKQQRVLEEKERGLEVEVEKRLDSERQRIAEVVKKQLEDSFERKTRESDEMLSALQEQLASRDEKLDIARKKEIEFLRKEVALQEKEQSMDLELARRLTESQGQLFEDAMKKAEESQQLKMREKEDLIKGLQDQVNILHRRMEQGSQEAQGEALEGLLQDTLSATFSSDIFEAVKKGAHGADIVQTVCNSQGRPCGKILWEAKNAKVYQSVWVDKLKQDQMDAGADLAVLMTVKLPANMKNFGQQEEGGVWLAEYAAAVGLCAALRQQLIRVAREKLIVEHRDTAKDGLFDYVTGPEFHLRVKAIVGTYVQMQSDLETEKRAMKRIWKKREKQITKVVGNMTEMHGELEGAVGSQASLPAVESLSLDHIILDDTEDDD